MCVAGHSHAQQERLTGLHVLFMSCAEPSDNPFLPLFEELVMAHDTTMAEHNFLCELLAGIGSKQFTGQSVSAVAKALTATPTKAAVPARLALYMDAYRSKQEHFERLASPWKRASLQRVVFHPDSRDDRAKREVLDGDADEALPAGAAAEPGSDGWHPGAASAEATKLLRTRNVSAAGFEPRWIRPAPPRLDAVDEVAWMDADVLTFDVLWDTALGSEHAPREELRHLLAQACREALPTQTQRMLLERLEQHYESSSSGGGGGSGADAHSAVTSLVTPVKLPALVENNPGVAIELLLRLMSASAIPEYLSVLVNMELTLHSMEVVNRLTTAVELPTEFVHLYISNCMASCKRVEDKFMQNRLVRLVCVFLQSLIRNKIVDVQDLFVEVQSFCIEHIKIREGETRQEHPAV